MRLQELINTALASPFTPEESQAEEAIYPSLMAVGVSGGVRYFLPFRPNVQIVYYNAEKFAQYHLQPPRTWPELLAVARTFYEEEQTGTCCSPAPAGRLRPHSSTSGLLPLEATRLTSHIQGQWTPSVF
jgi:hypothetical protein